MQAADPEASGCSFPKTLLAAGQNYYSLISMNSKENQIRLLLELKEAVKRNKRSIEEAQYHLSLTFLQECDSKQTEKKAKKLDNDMELIIHTALIEDRQDAAMSVIDEAIAYIDNLDP